MYSSKMVSALSVSLLLLNYLILSLRYRKKKNRYLLFLGHPFQLNYYRNLERQTEFSFSPRRPHEEKMRILKLNPKFQKQNSQFSIGGLGE